MGSWRGAIKNRQFDDDAIISTPHVPDSEELKLDKEVCMMIVERDKFSRSHHEFVDLIQEDLHNILDGACLNL